MKPLIYLICVLLVMSLACGVVTVTPGTVNTGDLIYTSPYKRATLAKPPEPAPLPLEVQGEKGLP